MSYMERALDLARCAVGTVSPNPAVGAVVFKDGKIVGEGWTQPPGQAHAEVMAIERAGPMAAGAILYTTLEPCCHFGRTPPCTEAIVDAGIAEVHVAMEDPNPRVNGGGLASLRAEGVKTHVGERHEEAHRLVEAYARFITTGRPFVTAKFAMSLDGKIATRVGDSRWITGEEARRRVHEMRAASDAVMVGVNTVLADDPRLTARGDDGAPKERQPLRVLVDSRGRTPASAKLLAEPGETLVAVAVADGSTVRRLEEAGAGVAALPGEHGSVDLDALLELLGDREITSVLVEGGGALLGSLFDRRLVDKVIAFVAPVIVGGGDAPTPVAGAGVGKIADALRLRDVFVERFGADTAIVGYC